MRAKGSFSVTDVISTIVEPDIYQGEVALQHQSGEKIYLGFNEDAVVGEGVCLSEDTPVIVVDDYRSLNAITAICASGLTATGSYQGA